MNSFVVGAFLSELEKIAQATSDSAPAANPNWKKNVAKAALTLGAGVGIGHGAGWLLTHHGFPSFFMNKGRPQTLNARGQATQLILPILGAAGFMLGTKARQKADEAYHQAPAWGKQEIDAF